MKTAWNILASLAIANLLALGGFVAFLVATDRLDWDRARDMRASLTRTVAQEKAETARSQAELEAQEAARAAEASANKLPITAEQRLQARVELTELDQARIERLRTEVQSLQATLNRERQELDVRQAAFEAQRIAFEQQIKAMEEQTRDQQFAKTLGVLQSVKPATAKAMLEQMLAMPGAGIATTPAASAASTQTGTSSPLLPAAPAPDASGSIVVDYLNAMEERARTRVMEVFAKDDPALAARLLEGVRRRGQTRPGPTAGGVTSRPPAPAE